MDSAEPFGKCVRTRRSVVRLQQSQVGEGRRKPSDGWRQAASDRRMADRAGDMGWSQESLRRNHGQGPIHPMRVVHTPGGRQWRPGGHAGLDAIPQRDGADNDGTHAHDVTVRVRGFLGDGLPEGSVRFPVQGEDGRDAGHEASDTSHGTRRLAREHRSDIRR